MAERIDGIYDNPEKLLKPDEVSAVVLQNYYRSRDDLIEKMRDKWNEWYKAYRAYVEVDDDDVRSNLAIPLIYSHVEALLPRLVANRPRIEAWGRGPGRGAGTRARTGLHRGCRTGCRGSGTGCSSRQARRRPRP